eukprot:GILI01010521.1.p1 GENE.GILI01010521.1~~GILI01010521.1.p1  ORF type:complete len:781 (-),score=204.90 GILI01010521.1:102-2444(-)
MASRGEAFDRLKIAVRERPLREEEKSKIQLMLRAENDKLVAFFPNSREGLLYNYDYFFPEEASQLDIFQSVGVEMVLLTLDGYSSNVVAFGASGTGKTHTMFGSDHEAGLIQLATKELFQRIEAFGPQRSYNVSMAYWEMNCDKIEDALGQYRDSKGTTITGRENVAATAGSVPFSSSSRGGGSTAKTTQRRTNSSDPFMSKRSNSSQPSTSGAPQPLKNSPVFTPSAFGVQRSEEGVFVTNLTKVPVPSWEALDEALMNGNIRRIHLAEERSARWHGFVKLYVSYTDQSDPDRVVSSTMTFAHLKGADRVGQKGARGDVLQQGSNINKSVSLFSSAMIHALDYRKKHLSKAKTDAEVADIIVQSQSFFMESKMTQILGQCVGGSECSFMVGTVSALDYHEATDTLEVLQNAQQFTAMVRRREHLTDKGKLKVKINEVEKQLPATDLAEGHPLSEIEERVLRLRRKLNKMDGIEEPDEDQELRVRARIDHAPIDTSKEDRLWKVNALAGKLHGDRNTVYIPNSKKSVNAYQGQWAHGKKEGYGKHETETTRYEGGWREGVREGEGTLWIRKDAKSEWFRVYTGGWKADKRDGIGHDFASKDGDVYEGGFKAGKRSGIGKMFLANGDRIEGQFRDGLVNGLAMLYCKNGDWYEGSWCNGLREGAGIYHYVRKQQIYEGEWHLGIAKTGVFSDVAEKETNQESSYVPRVWLEDGGESIVAQQKALLAQQRAEMGLKTADAPPAGSFAAKQHATHQEEDYDDIDDSTYHHQQGGRGGSEQVYW